MTRDEAIRAIALAHLRLDTLEPRKSDSLDFSDQPVWAIKAALEAAYHAGRNSVQVCAICGDRYEGHGHNAAPAMSGRCCDECHAKEVLPARLRELRDDQ